MQAQILFVSGSQSAIEELEKLLQDSDIGLMAMDPKKMSAINKQLADGRIDLVLLPFPAENKTIQTQYEEWLRLYPQIPFILFCLPDTTDKALEMFSKGVQDYVVQGETSAAGFQKTMRSSLKRIKLRSELDKARKEAEEALAYKDRMLARMSHQLRTPLNAITGFAELLSDTQLESKQSFYNNHIRENANKLVGFINDLLDFSKIEAGLISIHDHPFNMYDSVHECINAVLPAALQKSLDLVFHIASAFPPAVMGDDLRIRQLIMNLLENAIKFTDKGHVKLTVDQCEKHKDMFCIQVSDTGKGIQEELIPTLFKPYTKLDEDSGMKSGVGLGLAICQHLANQMHGTIEVESELKKGSVFTIRLPLRQPPRDFLEQLAEKEADPPAGKRICYITSDDLNDALLKDYCARWKLQLDIEHTTEDIPDFGKRLESYEMIITNLRPNKKLDLKLVDRVRAKKPMPHIMFKLPEKAYDRLTIIRKDTVVLLKPVKTDELKNAIRLVFMKNADQMNTIQRLPVADQHLGDSHPLDILVAEDNAINQKIIQGVLNRYNYQPKLVENGRLALEACQKRVYDVVLMDIQMPEMDGLTATREIRKALPASRQPLIVALTADALLKSRSDYREAGMDEVLYKPVQTRQLMDMLARTERISR